MNYKVSVHTMFWKAIVYKFEETWLSSGTMKPVLMDTLNWAHSELVPGTSAYIYKYLLQNCLKEKMPMMNKFKMSNLLWKLMQGSIPAVTIPPGLTPGICNFFPVGLQIPCPPGRQK